MTTTSPVKPEAWDCPDCGWVVQVRELRGGQWRVYAHKAVGGPFDSRWCPGSKVDIWKKDCALRMRQSANRPSPTLGTWTLWMTKADTHRRVWNRNTRRWSWQER